MERHYLVYVINLRTRHCFFGGRGGLLYSRKQVPHVNGDTNQVHLCNASNSFTGDKKKKSASPSSSLNHNKIIIVLSLFINKIIIVLSLFINKIIIVLLLFITFMLHSRQCRCDILNSLHMFLLLLHNNNV